jgi:anaerobic ribonucleoside-triphosphate reductase
MNEPETTDITLFVRTSNEDIARWDRQRIVDALIRETSIDVATAESVSREVEKQLISSGISLLTSSLIREMVDAKLIERGLDQSRRMHARLGFPLYDVRQLILNQNKENANIPHGPEGTNLLLSEGIKREYALYEVFSQDVGDAHVYGDIHLHGLGYVDRPYGSFNSLEYIKKFGLNIPNATTSAKPAKHPEVLLSHMVRFGASLQGYFAGVLAWDAVNLSFAPYLTKMNDKAIKQFAQMLIYEFSQLTAARGGQAIFTDMHLYWEVPRHYEELPVIGPGGQYTGKRYNDYLTFAQRLAWAIFEVFGEGDATGKPFIFPRPLVHISDKFFTTRGHEDFLRLVCNVASRKGNPCFIFDREILRASEDEKSKKELRASPWRIRSAAIQNVSINLPRLAYKGQGKEPSLFSLLNEYIGMAVKAHVQKRDFMEKLLHRGVDGPLSMLTMEHDGLPYLRMDNAVYLIGTVGLNELVQIYTGKQMHETEDALALGLRLMSHMKVEAQKWEDKLGMRFVIEQTPAETTSYRFARLDLKYFSPEAGHFVRGNLQKGEVYYTNSTQLNVSARLTPIERVSKEGILHHLMNSEAATQIWLGAIEPPDESIAGFVKKVFETTSSNQIIFSPEFTICAACNKTSQGLRDACSHCGSYDVNGMARITRYFSKTSSWNKGKLAELRDRTRFLEAF